MPSVDLRPTMLILDDLPQSCKDILSEGGIQLEFLDAHKASYAEIQLRMSYCNLIAIRTRKTAEIISYLLSYWPTSRLHAIACFEAGVASALTIKHVKKWRSSSSLPFHMHSPSSLLPFPSLPRLSPSRTLPTLSP